MIVILLTGASGVAFSAANPRVVLETNGGDIVIELYPKQAPVTVDNFLRYVHSGFYDGLLFHRIRYNFMIQGGGFYYANGTFYRPATFDPIVNESDNGLSNLRGTIAMARLGDDPYGNPQPHSATSQFYINHVDNPFLDREHAADGYGYCVFGRVIDGMSVVDAIAQVKTFQYLQENPPPPISFEALPEFWVGTISASVLPCGTSYCMNFSGGSRIDFEDFAAFAGRWLDTCDSTNAFCDGRDLNYDGTVGVMDLELFLIHWRQRAGWEIQFSDLEPDGQIDWDDLTALLVHWLDTGCDDSNDFCGGGDIDRDGAVNWVDFSLFSSHWLASY